MTTPRVSTKTVVKPLSTDNVNILVPSRLLQATHMSDMKSAPKVLIFCLLILSAPSCSHNQYRVHRKSVKSGVVREQPPPTVLSRVSLIAILADPIRFDGQDIQIEGFVCESERAFVLSPDLNSMAQNLTANLIYLDVSECRNKENLNKKGNPAHCYLKGSVDARDLGPQPYLPFACTFRAKECIMVVPLRGGEVNQGTALHHQLLLLKQPH